MASAYFKFVSMGDDVFVAEQRDSGNLVISGHNAEDFQELVDEEEIKTVSQFVKSGFSYWDISTITEEEANSIIDTPVDAETDVPEEVLVNEGPDSGPDGTNEGIGGAGGAEPRVPGSTP